MSIVRQIKLSPSSLGLFLDCPRCFWLTVNKGSGRPAGIFPSLPGGMDRILKAHFDNFRRKGELPPELGRNGFKGTLFSDQAQLDEWRDWRRFDVELGDLGVLMRGAVDDLLVDEDGETLIPFDFKTRGWAPKDDSHGHYHHQLCIYGMMLERKGRKVADHAYLLFYHPEKVNPDGSVLFNADLVRVEIDPKDAMDLIQDAVKCLRGDMPMAAEKCEYCQARGE